MFSKDVGSAVSLECSSTVWRVAGFTEFFFTEVNTGDVRTGVGQ